MKKRFLSTVMFAAVAAVTTASAADSALVKEDPNFVQNPVIWADVPDTSVCRVGDTYYMSSTTMHLNPGVPIMMSKDLINWEIVSYCYDNLLEDSLNQNAKDKLTLNNGQNEYGKGTWASCIRYSEKEKKFYVSSFSPTTGKTYIWTSDDPKKDNWKRVSSFQMFHDHSLVLDKDGRNYMIYNGGDRLIAELNADLSGVKRDGVRKTLITSQETAKAMGEQRGGFLLEGSQMHMINGKYYLFNIAWPGGKCRSVVCSRADNIMGPYEGKTVFQDQGIAQGGLVDTPDGKWYALLFGDRGGAGRIPYLAPVTWKDGWPMIGDENGKFPQGDVVKGVKHLTIPTGVVTSDEFNGEVGKRKLKLQWQWNHVPDDSLWSLKARPGFLRLTTGSVVDDITKARNLLGQRTFGPTCTAEIAMDVSAMKDGDYAGLSSFQKRYGFVGVKQVGNQKSIVMVSNNGRGAQEVESVPFTGKTAYFRVECDLRPANGSNSINLNPGRRDRSYFYYSMDGKTWKRIGDSIGMPYDMPHFMGYRFTIFNFATKTAGGHVDVDYYRIGNILSPESK